MGDTKKQRRREGLARFLDGWFGKNESSMRLREANRRNRQKRSLNRVP